MGGAVNAQGGTIDSHAAQQIVLNLKPLLIKVLLSSSVWCRVAHISECGVLLHTVLRAWRSSRGDDVEAVWAHPTKRIKDRLPNNREELYERPPDHRKESSDIGMSAT